MTQTRQPLFFESREAFRRWLEENHADEAELVVGFKKKSSGLPSITWPESVDEALCFGWIDGIRRKLDEESYTIRFTPRRPDSNWSDRNIRRMRRLVEQGRARPAGLDAFEKRSGDRSRVYSYEQRDRARFDADLERRFRGDETAWAWFGDQPPGYRKTATFWVMSAKRQATRERRLGILVECSARGERIPPLRRPSGESGDGSGDEVG